MEEIQNKAIENYQNNLKYLEQNDKELFQRLQALSLMIETGEYPERYHLEYIQEDNSFDLFDTKKQIYLYNKQTSHFDKNAVKNSNFDKQNTFDLFAHQFYNFKNKISIAENLPQLEKLTQMVANDISEYTSIFQNSTMDEKKQFKYIDRFFFIGTLLGTHIPAIAQKIKSTQYFICEENLEVFRLSLFTCPYYELGSSSRLVFSIMDDESHFINKVRQLCISNLASNYMIKYYSTNYNTVNSFNFMLKTILLLDPFKFTYYRNIYEVLARGFKNIKNYPTLHTNTSYTFLQNQPVLFIAAGPSLDNNIQWIQENQKNFFIVSIGAAVKKLLNHSITPDLITSADAGELVENHFPETNINEIRNTPFLCSQITYPAVCEKFDHTYLYEVMTTLKNTSVILGGASIGEVTLHLLLIMGANKIFMLGADLSIDEDTGATHAKGHSHEKTLDTDSDFTDSQSYSTKDTVLYVKGNFKESVPTASVFAKSIAAYNHIIKEYLTLNSACSIYNLSDGAFIENTIPLQPYQISFKNSSTLELPIKKFLDHNSSSQISSQDKFHLLKCVKFLESLLNEFNNFEKTKVKSYKVFLKEREQILNYLLLNLPKFENIGIADILLNYIHITEPYISYNFNNPNLQNEASLIKKTKKIWSSQMINLIKTVKDILQKNLD